MIGAPISRMGLKNLLAKSIMPFIQSSPDGIFIFYKIKNVSSSGIELLTKYR